MKKTTTSEDAMAAEATKNTNARRTGSSKSGSKKMRARGKTEKRAGGTALRQVPADSLAEFLQSDDPLKRAFAERLQRWILNALRNATPATLRQAVAAPTDAGSMACLLSIEASSDEAVRKLDPTAAAIIRGAEMKGELLKRAGGVLETARVAELLGISRQAVLKRVQSGRLLTVQDASGHLQFPACQFTDTGTVPGLETVLGAFNVDSPWTRLAVLLDTDEEVGGRRLIDALRAGDMEGVLEVVRSFGA
jgi:hypothetical protein